MAQFLRGFDACTVVSEGERMLVKGFAPSQCVIGVVPNGVDLASYAGDFGSPKPGTLIYPGGLTYDANLDAMRYFLHQIFPLVRAQHPGVRLSITGRYDGVPVEQLPLGENIDLTGYIPDIRPAIAESWACIVPLRGGGGTRLKILEALALGPTVVSPRQG